MINAKKTMSRAQKMIRDGLRRFPIECDSDTILRVRRASIDRQQQEALRQRKDEIASVTQYPHFPNTCRRDMKKVCKKTKRSLSFKAENKIEKDLIKTN